MKKILIISALLFMASMTQSKAQHFVASYGVQHQWGVPSYVTQVVYDRYYNYDWVHANRVNHGGGFFSFNVLLQRGNRFVEVNVDNHGYTQVINRYNSYPLMGHVCGDFCGFHEYYYNSYYNICHSHNHWGHNHVAYRPRPVTYVYGHYRTYPRYVYGGNTTVIYNNAPAKNHKHYKNHKQHTPQYSNSRQAPNRQRVDYEQRNSYQSRRSGYTGPKKVKYEEEDTRRKGRTDYNRSSRSSDNQRGRRGN